MSSALQSKNLTSGTMMMLCRVLDTAGIFDINTQWHLERRLRFGRVLIKALHEGITTESQLVEMVVSKIDMLHPSCIPSGTKDSSIDIAPLKNEGG
jgi:hypothetical protein